MGNVVISPNIKRESVRIDPGGNVINPRTKQIIQPVEPEFVPPVVEPKVELPKGNNGHIYDHEDANCNNCGAKWEDNTPCPNTNKKIGSKIDEMINRKIEELVAKKIEEALSKL